MSLGYKVLMGKNWTADPKDLGSNRSESWAFFQHCLALIITLENSCGSGMSKHDSNVKFLVKEI